MTGWGLAVRMSARPGDGAGEGRSGRSGLDVERAVAHLERNAGEVSRHLCLRAVRLAIEAGGVRFRTRVANAKDAGRPLQEVGFVALGGAGYRPVAGDVAVIQNYRGGSVAGHICMYTGSRWVSDFGQRDMWGGSGYRRLRPPFKVYRP